MTDTVIDKMLARDDARYAEEQQMKRDLWDDITEAEYDADDEQIMSDFMDIAEGMSHDNGGVWPPDFKKVLATYRRHFDSHLAARGR
jgi:hypothetical protein